MNIKKNVDLKNLKKEDESKINLEYFKINENDDFTWSIYDEDGKKIDLKIKINNVELQKTIKEIGSDEQRDQAKFRLLEKMSKDKRIKKVMDDFARS